MRGIMENLTQHHNHSAATPPGHHGHHEGHSHDDDHVVHPHGQHAGHSTAMFKDRFWLTLVLSVPVVYFSPMFGHLLGYMPPEFPGSAWIPPVLGTVIFFYGGMPFLKGGGIFIPTNRRYTLGDEVFLLLSLPEDKDRLPVAGKVVWITPPGSQGNRAAGIGVQFSDSA